MAKPIIDTNSLSWGQIRLIRREYGSRIWGFKLRDPINESIAQQQDRLAGANTLGDFKPADTGPRLSWLIKQYAALPMPPTMVTIPGWLPAKELRLVIQDRRDIGIILNGPLSTWDDAFCTKRFGASATDLLEEWSREWEGLQPQGFTCPGYLLESIYWTDSPMVFATGIRSPGKPQGGHVATITPEDSLVWGAYPVIGGEIIDNEPDPVAALGRLLDRCGC
jgi:hypothetical protein